MSVTVEDKIELFSKMIFGNIEASSSERRQKLMEAHNKDLEELRIKADKKKKEYEDAANAKAERERTKLIAQAKNQEQQLLIGQKQKSIHNVMERLYQLAAAYTDSQAYKEYLRKNISMAAEALRDSNDISFYLMEKDLQQGRHIIEELWSQSGKQTKYEIKKAPHNIIGGVIAEDLKNLLQIDLTIKALIEENKEEVGAAITRRFNEVNSNEQ